MAQASETLLRLSMELGGNAPFIVFEDADLDAAVQGAMLAKMRNIGEACTSANRFHVAGRGGRAVRREAGRQDGRDEARPRIDEDVDVGPLIDDDQRTKVSELVQDAIALGAKAVVGGSAVDGAGYFYQPTVLTDVPDDAKLLHEEIFGPVAPVKGFLDEDEAVAAANDTEYGWSRTCSRVISSARCAFASGSRPG